VPRTEAEWKEIQKGFYEQWNFPQCLGALDGKQINIRTCPNSGSWYYNYKQRFSIVLLAVVDADDKFLYVDIGCNERASDGGVF
uniref:DDE Tnp4 domain-containing protein n=1 Tax=Amphimedon queenslandica TaxID=400682 RepID=A0A1X7TMW9_AMPQE